MRGLASILLSVTALMVSVLGAILSYAPHERVVLEPRIADVRVQEIDLGMVVRGAEVVASTKLTLIQGRLSLLAFNTGNKDATLNDTEIKWIALRGGRRNGAGSFELGGNRVEESVFDTYAADICNPTRTRKSRESLELMIPLAASQSSSRAVFQESEIVDVEIDFSAKLLGARLGGVTDYLEPGRLVLACGQYYGRNGDGDQTETWSPLGLFVAGRDTGADGESVLTLRQVSEAVEQTDLVNRSRFSWLLSLLGG